MKTYKFTENGQEKELTYSELFDYFNGQIEKETGKKIWPRKAKLIIRVNRQGGLILI